MESIVTDDPLVAMFALPHDKETVDHLALLELIAKQEELIEKKPAKAAGLVHKFLGFSMSILNLELKTGTSMPSATISPAKLNMSSLKPRDSHELKLASLRLLSNLAKCVKKSRLFAFWYVFLPGCAVNPCKRGILELVNHPDVQIRERTLDLMVDIFRGSATQLQLANAHCRSGSFTPVCLEFAIALGRLVRCGSACLLDALKENFSHPSHVSQASRALVVLYEHIPFHRLENGLLTEMMEGILPSSLNNYSTNPVVQIAILQVYAALVSLSPPHPEIKAKFLPLFNWFCSLAFPSQGGETMITGTVDNNIRYVSVQNIGRLASLDTEQFLVKVDMLQPAMEIAICTDKDSSIVIHVLRLIKTIGKCGNFLTEESPFGAAAEESERRLLHFWLSVLKASLVDAIEGRCCAILKAALCDCIAEVGGKVFCSLPTDRRMLAVTFMLRQCRDSDHRTVTSASRGIGMMVFLPTLQNDNAFLTDSAEIILDLLGQNGSCQKQTHRNIVTSGTWTLANLADSLAKQYHQKAANGGEDSPGAADDFPPHLVLELIRIAIGFSSNASNHMNIRSNSVRSLGSLMQCLDSLVRWLHLDDNQEVRTMCQQSVEAIVLNVSSGKVMKVRWNASYAAGGILKTQHLFAKDREQRNKLFRALMPAMEECPNFKVRINAALALTSVSDRDNFGPMFIEVTVTTVRSLESALTNVEDVDEVQHRTDLIDQLCTTFAHMISLATVKDIIVLEEVLVEYADALSDTMRSVLIRVSPEKASVFVEAKRNLLAVTAPGTTSSPKEATGERLIFSIFPVAMPLWKA